MLHNRFLGLLDDHGLSQVVDKLTRNQASLDLMLMNISSYLNRVEMLPYIADNLNNVVLIEANIKLQRVKLEPRKVFLWRKGKRDEMKDKWNHFCDEYLSMD